jgi:alanine racemase
MSKISEKQRTWVEIDTKALIRNLKYLKKFLSGKTDLLCVVKSNAYGHGIVEISQILQKIGGVRLAVDSFDEAILLRKNNIKLPILVFGYTPKICFKDAVKYSIELTISNAKSLNEALLFRSSKPLCISIKVDTGLHRQGFLPEEKQKVLSMIGGSHKSISIKGLYSHFAISESKAHRKFTLMQVERLEGWSKAFRALGVSPDVHISSSAGLIMYPEAHFDVARAGIALYGLWPSPDIKKAAKNGKDLTPVLSFRTLISEIKTVKRGEAIGYDLTETLKRNSTIAVCPVGYWHGYPRSLSSVGMTLVNGKRAKVLGTISMDMMMIDVTGIKNVKEGTVVTLIGKDGNEYMSADEVAERAGTINYEIVTRINPFIKRIYR